MKKILRKIVPGDRDFVSGQKVLVWYENDWYQSALRHIVDKLYVILPSGPILCPNTANSVEVYILENVEDETEERKPRVFSVNWSAKYETELALEPGQRLSDAIFDIDPSPEFTKTENSTTQYIGDSFEVDYVEDSYTGKKIIDYNWNDVIG